MTRRSHMPLSVKLSAALIALGLDPKAVEYDHCPALGMRPRDPVTGVYDPPENDARYIVPRSTADHKAKTFGDHVPLSGDVSKIAKLKDVSRKHVEFRDRLLAKGTGAPAPAPGKRKQKIPSRPFPKRGKR